MKWSEILNPHEKLNPKETLHVLFPESNAPNKTKILQSWNVLSSRHSIQLSEEQQKFGDSTTVDFKIAL